MVSVIAKQFENVFPELNQQKDFVTKVVKEEEENFLNTIEKGLDLIYAFIDFGKSERKYLDKNETVIDMSLIKVRPALMEFIKDSEGTVSILHGNDKYKMNVLPGKLCFVLHDRYGFPVDLTKLIAKENGFEVDEEGFNSEMQKQKSRSRAATTVDTEDWITLIENPVAEFVGYDSLEVKSKIVKYRKVKSKGKEFFQIVLDVTPFYAESGGQVGDTGKLIMDNGELIIEDTKKENNLIVHFAETLPENLTGEVIAKVDADKRQSAAIHHTATHLLHAALRKILGMHVQQKGSLVNDEHLRFDFSHFAKVTDEEIKKIEELVNEKIRENIPVIIKEMQKDEALKLGAMALFGEKYGDIVRVVIIDPDYSVELCGGTHVGATGELGYFKITHETAVAAGVRRMEAVSGKAVEKYIEEQFASIHLINNSLKNPKDLLKAIDNLLVENAELKKKIESQEAKQLISIKNELLQKAQKINDVNFIGAIIDIANADALKKLCFDLKSELTNYIVVLTANIEGKASVAILLDEQIAAAKKLDASKIIKEIVAPIIKGGGGGQKTLATAGGQDASNLQAIIDKVRELL